MCLNPYLDYELLEGKNHAFLFSRYPYGLLYYACSTNCCSTNDLLSLIQNIRVEAAVPLVIILFCHAYNLRQLRQVQFKTMSLKFETRDEYNLRQVIDYLE